MTARVFVSCGQAHGEERETAKQIRELLRNQGFEPYIAIETQSIQDVNSGIIGELKKADYYVFIDFSRESLNDSREHRGSLFTNQELAMAYLLGFEEVIFLQQDGVKQEGIVRYMVSNPTRFKQHDEVPSLLNEAVQNRQWTPDYTRHLRARNPRWLEEKTEFIKYGDSAGNSWDAKPFYVDVQNRREDIGAESMRLRLAFITPDGQARQPCVDRSPLKATGQGGYVHDIWPNSHEAFDLFSVDIRKPTDIYLHSALDTRPRFPIITQTGTYKLDYVGWSRNFPILQFSVILKATGDLSTIDAELKPDGWD